MTHLTDVVQLLLEAAPSFRTLADIVEAGPSGNRPESYIAVFGEHLVQLLQANNTAEFPAVFALVEHLVTGDDELVRRHMGPFFFWMLLAAARRLSVDPGPFEQWLGPNTRVVWQETLERRKAVLGHLAEQLRLMNMQKRPTTE